ncbi:Keratin, type I cytoskeletal 18 [Microtus ochrogaster]|uniref:Keratin, type I cytoskeletal 18 n=1 Tax=Microtus ochrogaster TaxID=79684 RepID=A0A8J6GCC1_MICOH|nr:Keratin, type I cytoskeletal 18 [Microtus ochrogaster]
MSFTTRSTTFSTNYPASSVASVYAGAGGLWFPDFLMGSAGLVGKGGIQTEETLHDLDDRLVSYLDRVQSMETENRRLESNIREYLEKKGSQGIDNAHIAANDFRVKYETELDMRQSVESDIHGLKGGG